MKSRAIIRESVERGSASGSRLFLPDSPSLAAGNRLAQNSLSSLDLMLGMRLRRRLHRSGWRR